MKYEKTKVEVIMSEEEDVITASFEEAEDDINESWSGFF